MSCVASCFAFFCFALTIEILWMSCFVHRDFMDVLFCVPRDFMDVLFCLLWLSCFDLPEKRRKRKKGTPIFLSRFYGCPILRVFCILWMSCFAAFYGCPVLTCSCFDLPVLTFDLCLWMSRFDFDYIATTPL